MSITPVDPTGAMIAGPALGAGIESIGNIITTAMSNAQNLELYKRQQAYNTPAEQVKRLEKAGLNPVLAYGHGTVANVAQAPPREEAARISNPTQGIDFLQVMNAETQSRNIKLQENILTAQARSANADALDKEGMVKMKQDVYNATGIWPSNESGYVGVGLKAVGSTFRSLNTDRTSADNIPRTSSVPNPTPTPTREK